MIIDLKRSIDLRWLLMSGAIFLSDGLVYSFPLPSTIFFFVLFLSHIPPTFCCEWWSGPRLPESPCCQPSPSQPTSFVLFEIFFICQSHIIQFLTTCGQAMIKIAFGDDIFISQSHINQVHQTIIGLGLMSNRSDFSYWKYQFSYLWG